MENVPVKSQLKTECPPRVKVDVSIPSSPMSASPDMSPMAGPTCTANIMWYLREIDEEIRKDLAEYFSIGSFNSLNINMDNLDTYMYVCNSLQLRALKKHCQKLCVKMLTLENCLCVLRIAETNKSPYLVRHSAKIIEEHFGGIWKTEEFQCLEKNHIKALMKRSGIACHPDVLEALKYWLAHDRELRQDGFQDLVAHVEVVECKATDHLTVTISAGDVSGSEDDPPLENNNGKYNHIALLGVEGDSDKLTGIAIARESFTISQNKIRHVHSPGPEFAACSLEVDEAPYIVLSGGKQNAATQVQKYDVVLNKWKKCKPMARGRSRHCMVSVNTTVYVLGGFDGEKQLNSIEKYDFLKDTWQNVNCDLVHPVRSSACAVYNNQIYIFGGRDDGQRVSTVQCFDPERNTIRRLADLPCATSCGRAIELGHHIYIASGQGQLIRFDPDAETSELLADQPFHRIHFGMFSKQQKIYITGGIDTECERFSSIYEYDIEMNSWTSHGKLPMAGPIFGSCAVNFRPFADEK